MKENPEEKKEKDEAQEYDNFIGLLVTCNNDLDIKKNNISQNNINNIKATDLTKLEPTSNEQK